ncbi:MAG TPA: T9SS type A sorting domain-containing protein, partial [Mangrovimonas sp.]|nr:T9SS type A sorting domain-containing protein [Mangrovimonas sp.]
MKTKLIYLIMCVGVWAQAQTIEKFSIDSGGSSTSTGSIQILYTLGEVSVQEYSLGNLQVSEGFINSFPEGTLGLATETPAENVLLYPNPAHDRFYVTGTQPIKKLMLYDMSGKLMASTDQNQMAVGHLASGVYFVQIV